MSLRAMHWAWTVRLAPAPKLVLMALADEADDRGYCFPSVRRVANKCSISERTVQRIIRSLVAEAHVSVRPRFRKDRARSSNGYELALESPTTICHRVAGADVSGPPTPMTEGPRHSSHRAPDTVVGVTTTDPLSDPKQPPPPSENEQPPAAECDHISRALCVPRTLTDAQRRAILTQLSGVAPETAQQVLDELAGRMRMTQVRNPIRYCAALTKRLESGEFQPELGLDVAEQRRAERDRETRSRTRPSAGRSVGVGRLSEELKASLERMRPVSESVPDNAKLHTKSPDDSA